MRSKTPLTLIEMLIMVAVFSVASALCLKAFLWADNTSSDSVLNQRAMIAAQNAAETVKSCGGDYAKAAGILGGGAESAGEDWLQVSFDGFFVTVRTVESREFMEKAEVTVCTIESVESGAGGETGEAGNPTGSGEEAGDTGAAESAGILAQFEFAWQTEGND